MLGIQHQGVLNQVPTLLGIFGGISSSSSFSGEYLGQASDHQGTETSLCRKVHSAENRVCSRVSTGNRNWAQFGNIRCLLLGCLAEGVGVFKDSGMLEGTENRYATTVDVLHCWNMSFCCVVVIVAAAVVG